MFKRNVDGLKLLRLVERNELARLFELNVDDALSIEAFTFNPVLRLIWGSNLSVLDPFTLPEGFRMKFAGCAHTYGDCFVHCLVGTTLFGSKL